MPAEPSDVVTDCWTVVRLDDNGNEFEVASGLTETKARALLDQLESTAHKQHYWIREDRPAKRPTT